MEQAMKDDIKTDGDIEKRLQEAFEPVLLSTVYRDQLLQDLVVETSSIRKVSKPDRNILLRVG